MGKSIKNRIFGSDVPNWIKHKVESRQAYAKTSKPGDSILSAIDEKYKIQNDYGSLDTNFLGLTDLSSRTPFIRMWTSVNLTKDVVMVPLDEEEAKKFEIQRREEPDSIYKDNPIKNQYLTQNKDKSYVLHYWQAIPDSNKIYQLGNNILNGLPKDPTSTRENLKEITNENLNINISKSALHSVLPNPLEFNSHLSPPAGITGLSSNTEGPLGTLKRTTVSFVVHDFNDFERIYLRYFLKPGAQVFIDFGWDTSQLYDIKTMLDQSDLEEYLYGSDGVVSTSAGDMETLLGHVVNYDAKVRQDGGFDCSVEIVSKNASLLSNAFDPKLKERVKYGMDVEALSYAVSNVLGQPNLYVKATRWSEASSTQEELRTTFEIAASKLLGGLLTNVPGDDTPQGVLALEHGIFFGGAFEENQKLWINFGWFEDKFLNKELGFSDDLNSLTNNDKDSAKNDEKTFKAKFNSRNSFCTFSTKLAKAVNNRDFYNEASIIYPSNFGDDSKYSEVYTGMSEADKGTPGITYNIKRGMIPDRYDSNDGSIMEVPESYPDAYYRDAMTSDLTWGNTIDSNTGRIPLRETFLSFDMIKESLELSEGAIDFLQNIMSRIKNSTSGIIDLEIQSNSYVQNSICFVDKNVLNKNGINTSAGDELLVFKPYHPNTIVKNYELNFSMPKGGLGNMLSIQNSNNLSTVQSINDVIDGFLKQEYLERSKIEDVDKSKITINYTPSIGKEAGNRFEEIFKKSGQSDSFTFDNSHFIKGNNSNYVKYIDYENTGTSNGYKISSFKGFKQVINTQVGLALDQEKGLDGAFIPPKPKEESSEDTQKTAKEIAQANGETLVPTVYEYHLRTALSDVSITRSPIINIQAGLEIYGMSGFVPGDLIKIDYLPKHYRDNVFFQIMGISHDVSTTWSTKFETAMRVSPFTNQSDDGVYRVSKSFLRDAQALDQIDDFIHIFGNLEPIELRKENTHIDYCFKTQIIQDIDNDFQFPIMWTKKNDSVIKTLNIIGTYKLKDTKGVAGAGEIKYVFNNEFEWFGLKKVKNGIQIYATSIKKDADVYIWTSGKKWMVTNTYIDLQYTVEEAFSMVGSKLFNTKVIAQKKPSTGGSPTTGSYANNQTTNTYQNLKASGATVNSSGNIVVNSSQGGQNQAGSVVHTSSGRKYNN